MKLLFVTDGAYPDMTANSEIVFRLAKILREKYACDISILFRGGDSTKETVSDSFGFQLYPIRSLLRYEKIKKIENRFLRRALLICNPDCLRCAINFGFNRKYYIEEEYRYAIKKRIIADRYDCIIAVSFPPDTLIAMSKTKSAIPFVSYKLDPWSTNQSINYTDADRVDEEKADECASAIIVTELTKKDLIQNKLTKFLYKTYVLNFPNILQYKKEHNNITFGNGIHFLFAGRFYNNIRNPQYTFRLFERLRQKGYYFHVVGHTRDDFGEEYSVPDNIIFHGKVNSEMALCYMKAADILVNVGNTVLNQIPSKIYTYIALGKPILNIIKDPGCPTVPILEKYPLALNLLETEGPTEEELEQVSTFILNNKEKHVPYETIKQAYFDCTPEYVSGKLYEIICKVVSASRVEKPRKSGQFSSIMVQ